MKQFGLLLIIALWVLPTMSHAETVLRTGAGVSVESDQTVEGDYYVSSGLSKKTVMSGVITEDMYAAGASVTVNGEIGHDLTMFAGASQVHAPVADDVRIIGGEVVLADEIGGDVFVIAGTLSILSTAKIEGDVFFYGGTLSMEGDVAGSLFGKAKNMSINSHIEGDINVEVFDLVLGDSAIIDGLVTYTSHAPLTRSAGTSIGGEVTQNQYAAVSTRDHIRDLMIPVFVTLFATLCLYLLFKRELESLVVSVETTFFRNFLIGFLIIPLGFISAILLMVTVLGLFVGLMTSALVLLLYVAGFALVSVVLGAFVMRMFTKKLTVTLPVILVGAIATQVLLLIPMVGPLVLYVTFAVTVGALTQRLYRIVV